jgi:hypothetical protein
MEHLPPETRILVVPELGKWGGGASFETTWGEFCDANKDDPGELAAAETALIQQTEAVMGGGAQPVTFISLVAGTIG